MCLFLPAAAGQAADSLLSRGVDFSGVTLAVSAPEGDDTPRLLAQYLGGMEDIAQYCTVTAMEEEQALAALEKGEVTAVLVLPRDFIQGVMWGENPPLRLVVDGDRPLESLLLLWVGQSASDLLSAFQSGVYAVLELYDRAPGAGPDRDQVTLEINLEYISLALGREDLFRTEEVSATGLLPVKVHYTLALLCAFALSCAPLFLPLYRGSWLAFQRRLRCAGRGCGWGCFSAVTAGAGALLLLLAPGLLLAGGGLPALAAAGVLALLCALFCALCCLAARDAAGCGLLAFLIALAALALAGGILPPALLPAALRRLTGLSPVTWMMALAAWPLGHTPDPGALAALGAAGTGMAALVPALYRRRVEEVTS